MNLTIILPNYCPKNLVVSDKISIFATVSYMVQTFLRKATKGLAVMLAPLFVRLYEHKENRPSCVTAMGIIVAIRSTVVSRLRCNFIFRNMW